MAHYVVGGPAELFAHGQGCTDGRCSVSPATLTDTVRARDRCLSVDGNVLTSAIDTVANIIYLGLSLIGSIAFLYGLGRKMWLNRWSAYQTPPANLPTA